MMKRMDSKALFFVEQILKVSREDYRAHSQDLKLYSLSACATGTPKAIDIQQNLANEYLKRE